jgi:predicted ATPase
MGNRDLVPVLAHMMGLERGAGLTRMSPEELRRATFAALRSMVNRLMAVGPTVLVLEDLHWADPTSLLLTQDLAALAGDGPLLVLGTARPGPETVALERFLSPEATFPLHRLELGPLPEDAELELAQCLIGGTATKEALDAVRRGVEGNPLFLEEQLSSLVESGAVRHGQDGWHLVKSVRREVPQVLERLVRSRVDRLSPAAQEVVRAASVLGQEIGLGLLTAVCEAGAALGPAVAELCSRGLFQEVPQALEPTYRLRHALIQEATYRGLLRPERRHLHSRAAWALEVISADRLAEVAAVVGRHFAAAGEPERAVRYFEMAGDHAVAAFANDEAITSFCSAVEIADQDRSGSEAVRAAVRLRAKLADVFWRTGRRGEAREVLHAAIALSGPGDAIQGARLQNLLGNVEIDEHRYNAAMAAFDAAVELLGEQPDAQDEATADLWLEVMVEGRAVVHLFRNEPGLGMVALSAARPILEARGRPTRTHAFYRNLSWARAILGRFRLDEEVIAYARRGAASATEGGDEEDIALEAMFLGLFLTLHGDLEEAQEQTAKGLAMAERNGNVILRARTAVTTRRLSGPWPRRLWRRVRLPASPIWWGRPRHASPG